jgi:hypothetical protein
MGPTGIYIYVNKLMVKLSLCFNSVPRHEDVLGGGSIAPRNL